MYISYLSTMLNCINNINILNYSTVCSRNDSMNNEDLSIL